MREHHRVDEADAARERRGGELRHRAQQPGPEEERARRGERQVEALEEPQREERLMMKPPANESTLNRPASFHTVAREGPSGAGVIIVLTILFSAVLAGYESVNRLLYP